MGWTARRASIRPCRFHSRVGRVEGLCARVATRKFRPPFPVAIRIRSRRRRTGEETPQEFVKFDTRSGASEPHSTRRGAEFASAQGFGVLGADGDTHRQRRRKLAFELVQPIVQLMSDTVARVRARHGSPRGRGDSSGPSR